MITNDWQTQEETKRVQFVNKKYVGPQKSFIAQRMAINVKIRQRIENAGGRMLPISQRT